ncbi:MAG TPA: PDGLE domain-containing protein [Micromonosporaceae bacterium]
MRGVRTRWFLLGGLLLALLLAGIVSNLASSSPDGLDAVSRQGCEYSRGRITGGECIARSGREHEVGGPLAGYRIAGIDNPYLSTGLAGVVGVLLVFGTGTAVFRLARRDTATDRRHQPDPRNTG